MIYVEFGTKTAAEKYRSDLKSAQPVDTFEDVGEGPHVDHSKLAALPCAALDKHPTKARWMVSVAESLVQISIPAAGTVVAKHYSETVTHE